MKKSSYSVYRIVLCGMLLAVGVIINILYRIPIYELGGMTARISPGDFTVVLVAILFGPLYGGAIGALLDVTCFMIAPHGAYNPFMLIGFVLMGVIPGLFFMKGQQATYIRLVLAVLIGQIVSSILWNSTVLYFSYFQGADITVFLTVRLVNFAINTLIVGFGSIVLYKLLERAKVFRKPNDVFNGPSNIVAKNKR